MFTAGMFIMFFFRKIPMCASPDKHYTLFDGLVATNMIIWNWVSLLTRPARDGEI